MKIKDDELARLQDVAHKAYVQKNFDAAKTLLVAIAPIVAALREAQELIEKFEPSWHVYNDVLDSEGEIEAACCYCGASISDDCDDDCPYAIRERLGYG